MASHVIGWTIITLAAVILCGIWGSRWLPLQIRYLVDGCIVFWLAVIAVLAVIAGLWASAVAATLSALVMSWVTASSFRKRLELLEGRGHGRA
jgi:hypothetical protein